MIVVFQAVVVFCGAVGMVGNGLVLKVLLEKNIRMKTTHTLILNQVSLDFTSCIFLIIDYGIRIRNTQKALSLPDGFGKFVCLFLMNDLLLFSSLVASIGSLVSITLERYFKIVHPIQHRKMFRPWMTKLTIFLTWIYGFSLNMPGLWTSNVKGGKCYAYSFWPSNRDATIFGYIGIFLEFPIPLAIFVYCYGHILYILARKNKINIQQPPGPAKTTTETGSQNNDRSQMNVVKTLILVSVAFFVCWLPNQLYYLINLQTDSQFDGTIYCVTLFMIFMNVILNPFIYAWKHEAVHRRLMEWKKKIRTGGSGLQIVQVNSIESKY